MLFNNRQNELAICKAFKKSSTQLAAACLIISEHIDKYRNEAKHVFAEYLSGDQTIDPITAVLCLESLQFIKVSATDKQKVIDFLISFQTWSDPPELANILLEQLRQ